VVERTLTGIAEARVVQRIHDMDHTVWKDSPAQITDRLGWLFSPAKMRQRVHELSAFAEEVRSAGYTRALLLGMGGSSLAPEVLSTTFGAREGFLSLCVLDSTDPSTITSLAGDIEPSRTLFIVSTKSGTTVETLSLFKYFYNRTAAALGREAAGGHFVAITDPGNPLNETALRCAFRKVFSGEPTIGDVSRPSRSSASCQERSSASTYRDSSSAPSPWPTPAGRRMSRSWAPTTAPSSARPWES